MGLIIIGGSPCSGKSTFAKKYAEEFGYQYISTDDYLQKHINESSASEPILHQWKTEPWHSLLRRNSNIQFEEMISFYELEWRYLLPELKAIINQKNVILEGCAFLPSIVNQFFKEANVLYLIPSKSFQVEQYKLRTWINDILNNAEDKALTFERWMERDHLFSNYIKEKTQQFHYPVYINDGTIDLNQMYHQLVRMIESKQEDVFTRR